MQNDHFHYCFEVSLTWNLTLSTRSFSRIVTTLPKLDGFAKFAGLNRLEFNFSKGLFNAKYPSSAQVFNNSALKGLEPLPRLNTRRNFGLFHERFFCVNLRVHSIIIFRSSSEECSVMAFKNASARFRSYDKKILLTQQIQQNTKSALERLFNHTWTWKGF